MTEEWTHRFRAWPSYDHREQPDGKGGARGAIVTMVAYAPDGGAITCDIYTDWMAHPLKERFDWERPRPWLRDEKAGPDAGYSGVFGGPVAVHYPRQLEDWWPEHTDCPYLDGATCYGDLGYTLGDRVFQTLVEVGDEAAFAQLHEIYERNTKEEDTV